MSPLKLAEKRRVKHAIEEEPLPQPPKVELVEADSGNTNHDAAPVDPGTKPLEPTDLHHSPVADHAAKSGHQTGPPVKKARKKAEKRKKRPPRDLPVAAFNVAEWCRSVGISRASYYNMPLHLRPDELRFGRRVLITVEASADWCRRFCKPPGEPASIPGRPNPEVQPIP